MSRADTGLPDRLHQVVERDTREFWAASAIVPVSPPKTPTARNGKRVAYIGAVSASLTVARDLAQVGYEVTVFDNGRQSGDMMRGKIITRK